MNVSLGIDLSEQRLTEIADSVTTAASRFGEGVGQAKPDAILGALIVGAFPSPDGLRAKQLMEGGLPALRAFTHLTTVHASLKALRADPFDDASLLEESLKTGGDTHQGFERVVVRMRLLHGTADGLALWEAAYAEGFRADQALVAELLALEGSKPDRGLLFWYDPGLTDDQKNLAASVMLRLGLVVPPRSAAPRAGMLKAYEALVARAA